MLKKFEVENRLGIVIIIIIICKWCQEFLNGILDQQGVAKYPHDLHDRPVQFEVVFNNGNETICDDGDMYLYSNSILRFSPKGFDAQMLLNPFEEKFNLPSVAVKKSNVLCVEIEVVCVVGEGPSKVRGIVYDPPERNGIIFTVSRSCESDRLISQDIVISFKHVFTFSDFIIRMKLLPNDEKSPSLINREESGEVKVASVKHIACLPFVDNRVHELGIMHICMANSVKYRYFSGNINLSMNFNPGLCTSELCPSKDRHAQVDGSGINGIKPSVEFKIFCDTFGLGNRNNVKGKLFKNPRVSEVVNFGKDASVNWNLSKSQVKRPFCMSSCDIGEFSKTMTTCELTEHYDQHMTPVRWCHTSCPVFVFDDQPVEVTFREKLHNLCENIFANIHACSILRLHAKEQNSKGRQGF